MILKKRVVSTHEVHKLNSNNLIKNRIKFETVNYNKFSPIPNYEDEQLDK